MNMMAETSLTSRLSEWTVKRAQQPYEPGGEIPDQVSYMDRLWQRLAALFPTQWAPKFTSADSIRNWAELWAIGFCEECLTPEEVQLGLRALRRHRFPPSLGEFIQVCRPILTDEQAYYEACDQMKRRRRPRLLPTGERVSDDKWSEPAIYWAAARMGSDLLNRTYPEVKVRWARILEIERKKPRREVPAPMLAIEAPKPEPKISEADQKRIIGDLLTTLRKPAPRPSSRPSDHDLEARKRAMADLLVMRQHNQAEAALAR